jgi:hypothetical protein
VLTVGRPAGSRQLELDLADPAADVEHGCALHAALGEQLDPAST